MIISRRAQPRVARFVRAFMLIMGIGLQIGAGVVAISVERWLSTSTATTGKVVDLERKSGRKGRSYAERVTFQDGQGATHEFVSSLSTSHPYAVGSTVPVRYDPNEPTSAGIDTHFRNWFIPGLLFAMGLVFTLVGFLARRRC